MPSGYHGCRACAETTAGMLRLRQDEFVRVGLERDGKRHVAQTRSWSFCDRHLDLAFDVAFDAVMEWSDATFEEEVMNEPLPDRAAFRERQNDA